ncbi:hypothetical protein Bbelb_200390 [Branchiostoma belcheri]|nr:hypothetical protein Bbelb_200390 [Branchiostoma belcheri]
MRDSPHVRVKAAYNSDIMITYWDQRMTLDLLQEDMKMCHFNEDKPFTINCHKHNTSRGQPSVTQPGRGNALGEAVARLADGDASGPLEVPRDLARSKTCSNTTSNANSNTSNPTSHATFNASLTPARLSRAGRGVWRNVPVRPPVISLDAADQ